MHYARAEFPQLDEKQAAFSNYRLTHELTLSLGNHDALMQFSDFKLVAQLPDGVLLIKLQLGIHQFYCAISLGDAAVFFEHYFAGVDFCSIPLLLVEAALEKILSAYQSCLKANYGEAVEILDVTVCKGRHVEKSERSLSKVKLVLGNIDLAVYCLAEQGDWVAFFMRYAVPRSCGSINPLLKVELRFGHTDLTPAQLSDLAYGDLIFFETCYYANDRKLRLIIQQTTSWLVQLHNESIHVIKPWGQIMSQEEISSYRADFSDEDKATSVEDSELTVEDGGASVDGKTAVVDIMKIAVPVHFEMPVQYLPLSQVQALTEGYVFDLQVEPDSAIHIKVNGQKIALGELVKVGEKLGVRITRVN